MADSFSAIAYVTPRRAHHFLFSGLVGTLAVAIPFPFVSASPRTPWMKPTHGVHDQDAVGTTNYPLMNSISSVMVTSISNQHAAILQQGMRSYGA